MAKINEANRSRVMASIRSNGNRTTEQRLRMLLVRAGISGWRLLPSDVVGNPDFIFSTIAVAVFVDGCFWHGCPKCYRRPTYNQAYWDEKISRTKLRDKRLRAQLRRDGWRVLSIWEHELKHPQRVTKRLLAMLKVEHVTG